MAAAKLSLPADQLTVTDGVVHAKSDASKKASYAELIGGRYFNVQLDWNKQMGNTLYAPGKAQPKDPKDYKIVGKPLAREDIAPKVYAQEDFCTDVKVPGMVHGRMIRPAIAGAVPVKVDEGSIKDIPGAKVVREKGFLGVVADKEWDAIKASQKLKVEWSDVKPPFPDQAALYDHIRKAPVRKREIGGKEAGNVDEAFKTAARVIEAEYEWPFQSHACMGPACAVVEIKDGNVTCWTGSQKPHFVQNGIAATIGVPVEKVRSIWMVGPGSYGRSDADDAAMDAAVLAKAVGKPVRVQYTRDAGDRLGSERPRLDPPRPRRDRRRRQGDRLRVHQQGLLPHRRATPTAASREDTLAGQLPRRRVQIRRRFRRAGGILRVRQQAHGVGDDPAAARPRFAAAQRASARSGRTADPLRQRIVHGRGGGRAQRRPDRVPPAPRQGPARHRGAQGGGREGGLAIAALAAQGPDRQQGERPRHRLFAAQRHARAPSSPRSTSTARTGKIWARKFTVAHDCGQVINPDGLKHTIKGNIIQGMSRTLWEEVKFDAKNVTSVDWMTYPILDITETPETIEVVMIDRPELPPTGAGEPSIRPVAAAIANAIFDATGVRIRRVPFSPDRVKQSLS